MSHIKPFKAVYYNSRKIKDFIKVVSPPYDVISPEEQDYLHNLSPYNFTHIDFGKDALNDDKINNKYTRAKEIYDEWLKKDILLKDDESCIYFYKQDYKIMGEKYYLPHNAINISSKLLPSYVAVILPRYAQVTPP